MDTWNESVIFVSWKALQTFYEKRNFRVNDSVSIKLFFTLNFFNYLCEVYSTFYFILHSAIFSIRKFIYVSLSVFFGCTELHSRISETKKYIRKYKEVTIPLFLLFLWALTPNKVIEKNSLPSIVLYSHAFNIFFTMFDFILQT